MLPSGRIWYASSSSSFSCSLSFLVFSLFLSLFSLFWAGQGWVSLPLWGWVSRMVAWCCVAVVLLTPHFTHSIFLSTPYQPLPQQARGVRELTNHQIYDVDLVPLLVQTAKDLFENYRVREFLISATLRNEHTFGAFLKACGAFYSFSVQPSSSVLSPNPTILHELGVCTLTLIDLYRRPTSNRRTYPV